MMNSKLKLFSTVLALAIMCQSVHAAKWHSYSGNVMENLIKMSDDDFYNAMIDLSEDDHEAEGSVATDIDIPIGSETITVNGVETNIRNIDSGAECAINYHGTTMVPLRVLANLLDCDIVWDNDNKTATVSKEGITFTVNTVTVTDINVNVPRENNTGILYNNKAMMPLRFISETFGSGVGWNQSDGGVASISNYNDDAFKVCRLIVKLKSQNRLEALSDVISKAKNAFVNDENIMILSFEDAGETKRVYNILNKNSSNIEYVEPDRVLDLEFVNDEKSVSGNSWDNKMCGFEDYINENKDSFNGNVTVGVIDTGINVNHDVFSGRASDVTGLGDIHSGFGHGTHVAGIIANATKPVGDKIKIKGYLGVSNRIGQITSSGVIYSAYQLAAEECDVINMSLGFTGDEDNCKIFGECTQKLVVVAAGNASGTIPLNSLANRIATKSNGICVTAVDSQQSPAWFTDKSFNTSCQKSMIAAPGVDIVSATNKGNNTWYTASGTSQAAPHVAAAAALVMLAEGKNPEKTKRTLLSMVKHPNNLEKKYGVGILDMSAVDEEDDEDEGKIIGYSWSETNISLNTNDKKQVTLYANTSVSRKDVTETMKFRSVNENIAAISQNGEIIAKGKGKTEIVLDIDPSVCIKVEVKDPESEEDEQDDNNQQEDNRQEQNDNSQDDVGTHEWSETELGMTVGGTKKVTLYYNVNGNKTDVTRKSSFYSSNEGVVRISQDGTLTAIGEGNAYIMLEQGGIETNNSDARKTRIKVSVTKASNEITAYEWSVNDIELTVGESIAVKLFAKMSDGTKKDVTRSSSFKTGEEAIASITQDGIITAKNAGTTQVVLEQGGGINDVSMGRASKIKIKVVAEENEVTAYEWSQTDIVLDEGSTERVKLYAVMSNGEKKDITSDSEFYSDNEGIATINRDGEIRAIGAGSTNIVLTQGVINSINTRKAKIKVTVNAIASDYDYSDYGSGVEITKYNGSEKYVTIPSKLGGKKVVRIGDDAFADNTGIASVDIPSTVHEIGKSAFKGCKGLKGITIPSGVESIEAYAFDSCSKLSGLSLPRSLCAISAYCFRGCSNLKEITIPGNVTEIGNGAFVNCKSITVIIPENVTSIDSGAFSKKDYVIILGSEGSVASEYANEKGYSFYEE